MVQIDAGVDEFDFYPVSYQRIKEIITLKAMNHDNKK